MARYLKISSLGLMDIEALSLVGASTKRGDGTSIGMFGSGLKYSLATMLRQQMNFKIFSGFNEFKVTTQEVEFGTKKFNKIYINGEPTSLTDSMGALDWTGVWPFVREIYSNALDEGEASINIVDEIDPDATHTNYYIEMNTELEGLVKDFEHYFLTPSKALYVGNQGAVHKGTGGVRVFRKGILVYEDKNEPAMFNYDLQNIRINESRELKHRWEAQDHIGRMIEECTDDTIIATFIGSLIGSNTGSFEQKCVLSEYEHIKPSQQFINYIAKNKFYPVELDMMLEPEEKHGRLCLPLSILRRFLKAYTDADILGLSTSSQEIGNAFIEAEPSVQLKEKINEAIDLLQSTSYKSRLKANIKCVNFKSSRVQGMWDTKDNRILLSTKLDVKSVREIAAVIIEEQEHGITGFSDNTRNFQNHLFDLVIGYLGETTQVEDLRNQQRESRETIERLNNENRRLTALIPRPTKWQRIKTILFNGNSTGKEV